MSFEEIVKNLEKYDVAGQVIDKNNSPIAGADVFLYYDCGVSGLRDRLSGKTKTNNEGKFNFEKAIVWEPKIEMKKLSSKPRYGVIARHNDYGINFVVISQNDRTENIQIILDKPNFKDITVTDSNGNKIENALVYLYAGTNDLSTLNLKSETLTLKPQTFSLHQDIGLSSGLTDKDGKVELMCFPSDSSFRGVKEGYTRNYSYEGNIILFPEAQISGKVAYEDGSPAEGMVVWFEYYGELVWEEVTTTDKDGRYEFKNLPATGFRYSQTKKEDIEGVKGEGTLLVEDIRPHSNYVSKLEKFSINPGDKLIKDIKLIKGVVISGKVINLDTSEPLPNFNLQCNYERNFVYLKTDEKGEFHTVMAPGTEITLISFSGAYGDYIIDEEWSGMIGYKLFRGIVSEDMRNLIFPVKLRNTNKLTGKVVDESGKGVKNIDVYNTYDFKSVTNEKGEFEIKVDPKKEDLTLFTTTYDNKFAGFVKLKTGATSAEIKLEPTQTYQGEVINDDGTPAQNFKFSGGLIFGEFYQTDENGKVTFHNLCPQATYNFSWWSDERTNREYDSDYVTIDLTTLKPGEPIQIILKRYINAFIGKVFNEKKEPIAGASVELKSEDMAPRDCRNRLIQSDKDGEFIISRLASGDVEFIVKAKGYNPKNVKAPSDSINYEIILEPSVEEMVNKKEGAIYRVTVVDEEDKPIVNAPVTLQMTLCGKMWIECEETITAKTDAAGKAEIAYKLPQGLSHGYGNIFSDTEGYDLAFWRVSTMEDADVKLMLRKGGEYWSGYVLDQLTQKPQEGAKIKVVSFSQEINKGWRSLFIGTEHVIVFTTDADGKFELKRFNKKDSVGFHILAPGYERVIAATFQIQEMGNVFRLLPGATIKGKLLFKGTGEPFKKKIELSIRETGYEKRDGGWEILNTSEDGTFIVDTLKPGEYKIALNSFKPEDRKYICVSQPKVNIQPKKTVDVTLEIEEGIRVTGRVIDTKTGKLPDVWITVFGCIKSVDDAFTGMMVNEDGTWELYMPEGTFNIGYNIPGMKEPKIVMPITVEKGKTYNNILIDISE